MNRYSETLSWIANSFVMIGSFLTAHGRPEIGFATCLLGSVLFMEYARATSQRSFFCFNIFYTLVNAYGIINWGFR